MPNLPRVRWNTNQAKAELQNRAPRIPWDKFIGKVYDPRPGEHEAIIGPTGQGKTYLQANLLLTKHSGRLLHQFIAVFATKPADVTMDRLIATGRFTRLDKWKALNPIDHPRRVIWPDARRLDSIEIQKAVFSDALNRIFREGGRPAHAPVGWTVAIDELWYIINILGLGVQIKVFLLQARSLGHSLLIATQRPRFVPLEVYDQSTHLFFFRDNDEENLKRLSEIQTKDKQLIKMVVANLETHQVLYINTRTGLMCRTRAPAPKRG